MKSKHRKLDASQKKFLKDMKVGVVYLFGSQAEGFATPLSDVDVGVVFQDSATVYSNTNEIYTKLYSFFTDLFPGQKVDIVFLQRAGLELRFDAIAHGIVLFETSSDFRLDFEEHTTNSYLDFKPILREFNKALIENV